MPGELEGTAAEQVADIETPIGLRGRRALLMGAPAERLGRLQIRDGREHLNELRVAGAELLPGLAAVTDELVDVPPAGLVGAESHVLLLLPGGVLVRPGLGVPADRQVAGRVEYVMGVGRRGQRAGHVADHVGLVLRGSWAGGATAGDGERRGGDHGGPPPPRGVARAAPPTA